MVSSALTLHRHDTGRETRVVTAMTILKTHLARYGLLAFCQLHQAHVALIFYLEDDVVSNN